MALDRLDECRANLRFITRALESADFSSVITGVAQPQITRESLSRLQIPLPPLAEQKRIAAILDAADALRAKRRESLAQLDTLLQSTFLDMFGDPVINPMGWEVVQLGDVANFHAGSTLPDGEEFTGQLGGFLYLKVGDLNHPDNMTAIVRANLWAASRAKGIMAPADSILIPKRGGAIGTNKKRLLTRQAVLDPNLMAISAGDGMSHQYILRWFHTFDLMSIASGSSVPQLNKKDLAPLRIPRPPFGIQLRFATIVESVEQQKARLREHLAELDTLFASLQQRAFNGDL
jgi:type I restriction enzyme S subunit